MKTLKLHFYGVQINEWLTQKRGFMMGKGHYYENHNVENQKEHQKICKPSLHRNVALS
jgi:hypothetical protein